jgi:dihydropteroate synthase
MQQFVGANGVRPAQFTHFPLLICYNTPMPKDHQFNARILTLDPRLLLQEIASVGPDEAGVPKIAAKSEHYIIKVEGVRTPAANILKQELLARGADGAVSRNTIPVTAPTTDMLIYASMAQLRSLARNLKEQPYGLAALGEQLAALLDNLHRAPLPITCGPYTLPLGSRTLVMGILNLTPDSFSGDGLGRDVEAALQQARAFHAAGADLLDLGAESTRPGSSEISADDELARLTPVLQALLDSTRGVLLPISIDTKKASVIDACLKMGAHLANDISGLRADPSYAATVARYNAPVIIMHMKGTPDTMQQHPQYSDLLGEVIAYLREGISIATTAGIAREKVIIDAGIGFGKTFDHNLELLHRLGELRSLGQPILVGTSRKGFIGKLLGGVPAQERIFGTAATVALSIAGGADIVRVHDVAEMVQVVKVADAIVRTQSITPLSSGGAAGMGQPPPPAGEVGRGQ